MIRLKILVENDPELIAFLEQQFCLSVYDRENCIVDCPDCMTIDFIQGLEATGVHYDLFLDKDL